MPQACLEPTAANGAVPGTGTGGAADRAGADAAPVPHQASVLGLLRTGHRDARQRRVSRTERTDRAQEQTGAGAWAELEPQSRVENLFKGAATTASMRDGVVREIYLALLEKGMRPEMARLTVARKIAAITLKIWKQGEAFDREHLKPQQAA